jgi:hypothetical protein
MVLTAYSALSLVIGLSCHHPRRDALGIIGRLTSASRCQDHTASPSALAAPVLRRQSVHRIPRPTSVTIAKRPSSEAGWREGVKVIWERDKAKYFSAQDWTTQIRLKWLDKFRFWRRASGAVRKAPIVRCKIKHRSLLVD